MRRSENLAWAALAGLLTIAVILLIGGFMFHFTAFWAGALLATGESLIVGLAAWGLSLARQAQELQELPAVSGQAESLRPFRMSVGDDAPKTRNAGDVLEEVKTLDTGFQRLLVGVSGALMVLLGGIAGYFVYVVYRWSQQNPDQAVPIAGSFTSPRWMDELSLIMGLGAAAIYGIFYWLSRPKRDYDGTGEAITSNFALGITAMAALAAGSVLGYFRVSWASEVAAGVMVFFMLLQGLELLVNSMRSYSSIEELDQEAIDLQAYPLSPMLSSIWLAGLRMLFAQSVGISGEARHERGVIARMMPRTLAAIAVIGIGVSCLRVVQPGEVAVLERLGYALTEKATGKLKILQPGMHVTLPWPIDNMVYIPTQELQRTDVGTELHAPKEWKGVDFQFWTYRDSDVTSDVEDLFLTGDLTPAGQASPQILETYVQVRWRVADPAAFYNAISHSEFYEKGGGGAETKTLPIYEAIVQQCTSFAVTRTFAIHSLDQVMTEDRREVEMHCREILQKKLDSMNSGIEVAYLTIKDLHPPYWRADRYDPSEPRIGGVAQFTDNGVEIRDAPELGPRGQGRVARGPASAFEFVISMREFREQIIDLARADATVKIKQAEAFAESEKKRAQTYSLDKVARAHGDADRLVKMTEKMDPAQQHFQLQLMQQQLLYTTLKDLLDPVGKIIVDPDLKDVQIYNTTDKSVVPPIRP